MLAEAFCGFFDEWEGDLTIWLQNKLTNQRLRNRQFIYIYLFTGNFMLDNRESKVYPWDFWQGADHPSSQVKPKFHSWFKVQPIFKGCSKE